MLAKLLILLIFYEHKNNMKTCKSFIFIKNITLVNTNNENIKLAFFEVFEKKGRPFHLLLDGTSVKS